MSHLLVVSFQDYQNHRLELRHGGGARCAVVIHPPASRGQSHQVPRDAGPATLTTLIGRAKGMVDAVLGPRPPPRRLELHGRMADAPLNA
jgi:hypothetical protein